MENVRLTELPGDQKNRKPLCDIQINADNVTTNLYTNTREFKEYLESFMHEELYKLVIQDVFSILPPDTPLDMVVSQVTEYLKSDTATSQLSPVAVREPRTRKRRTADFEIYEKGISLLENSPSPSNKVRRRSKRLRSSLALYGKPRVAPALRQKPSSGLDLKVFDQKGVDVPNSYSENFPELPRTDESYTNDPCADIPCVDVISADTDIPCSDVPSVDMASADMASADVPSVDMASADMPSADMASVDMLSADVANTDYSEAEPPMCPSLDASLANISSSTFIIDDEQFPLPQDLVNLYTNTNYVAPSPTTLSTIFETPRLVKGDEVFYSKVAKYRYFKFDEGCWYHVPPAKRILRRKKARNNGWTKATKAIDQQCASLVSDAMNRLDKLMLEDSD